MNHKVPGPLPMSPWQQATERQVWVEHCAIDKAPVIAQTGGCHDPHYWRGKSAEVKRGRAARVQISALPLSSCMMLRQLLNLSVPQFPQMKHKDYNNSDNNTYLIGILKD